MGEGLHPPKPWSPIQSHTISISVKPAKAQGALSLITAISWTQTTDSESGRLVPKRQCKHTQLPYSPRSQPTGRGPEPTSDPLMRTAKQSGLSSGLPREPGLMSAARSPALNEDERACQKPLVLSVSVELSLSVTGADGWIMSD